jgi:hypothetical protein
MDTCELYTDHEGKVAELISRDVLNKRDLIENFVPVAIKQGPNGA